MLAGALAVGLLAWSVGANLRLGDRGYLPRNLLATAVLLALAHAVGLRAPELGLTFDRAAAGAAWGAVTAAAVAAVLVAAAASAPRLRPVAVLLQDDRAALPGRAVAYHTLLRIPLGTAAFEEVAFRGVLLAATLEVLPTTAAVLWSAAAFGLWHVPPTIVTLRINDVPARSRRGVAAIAGAVVVTTIAGVGFAALRLGSGSLAAPVLAHWATNAGGMLAARWTRSRRLP